MAGLRTPLVLVIGLSIWSSAARAEPPAEKAAQRTDVYGDPLPEGAIARIGTQRFGHRNDVLSLSYSPDGKLLYAGGPVLNPFNSKDQSSSIRVWDAAAGKLIRSFGAGRFGGRLALSFDGRVLAANSGAEKLLILDVNSGQVIRECELNGEPVGDNELVFSPNGKVLACCGEGIQFFDPTTGKRLLHFGKSANQVRSVVFSPDGKSLASAGFLVGEIGLWDVSTGKLLRQFNGRKASHVAFSPDGKLLAAGDGWDFKPGVILLWDVATGKELRRFEGHQDEIHTIVFSRDGRTVASAGRDKTIRLWDVRSGKQSRTLESRHFMTYCLAFAPDGKRLASGSDDTICVWDVETGKPMYPLQGHLNSINSLAFATDGSVLATGSWDGTARLWNAVTGEETRRIEASKGSIDKVAFSPDDKMVVTSSADVIRLWQNPTGQELRSFSATGHRIKSLFFCPDGKHLLTAGYDHTIRSWDVATGKEIGKSPHSSNWHRIPTIPVAFSADGQLLASGEGYDKGIILREVATGKEVPGFGERENVTDLAFSPDARILAQASGTFPRQNIRIWDVRSRTELHQLKGHSKGSYCLAFSTDGRTIVSGGEDEMVRLWEVATGEEIRRWAGHDGRVGMVAFSRDHRIVASRSWDKTILILDTTGRLHNGRLRPANLSPQELEVCWEKLSGDASVAYSVIWKLAASNQAAPFLKQRLRPARLVGNESIARLIAELDSEDFRTREKATQELEEMEERAETALRQAAEKGSTEVRRRASRLLGKLSNPIPPPERARRMRAVAALEYSNNAAARDVLRTLAGGTPKARLTQEAKLALQRLEKRVGN